MGDRRADGGGAVSGFTGVVASAFQLSFEISPIFLVNGIANASPLGVIPILALTETASFLTGILSGSPPTDLNQYFAHFVPMGGGTLIDVAYAKVPFANQQIAANAAIVQPLKISLEMNCPATNSTSYAVKLATMTALKFALDQHINQGGWFSIATPAYIYTNALLNRLADITTGGTGQRQLRYQWDFELPLLTLQQAQAAQNTLMQNITNGTQTDGSLTGPGVQAGNQANNLQPLQAQGGYGGGFGG
jgi:hypothetical protein